MFSRNQPGDAIGLRDHCSRSFRAVSLMVGIIHEFIVQCPLIRYDIR